MEYERNSDLSYYETNRLATNCGSYALRLSEWYELFYYGADNFEDEEDYILEMFNYESDAHEVANMYRDILLDKLFDDFPDELEMCSGAPPDNDNEELIAFNTRCYDGDYYIDYDFHFRVFRDGKWMEKCGCCEVSECDINDWGKYNGTPVYMYHRIGD